MDRKRSVHRVPEKERSLENRASEAREWSQGGVAKREVGEVGRSHTI